MTEILTLDPSQNSHKGKGTEKIVQTITETIQDLSLILLKK